MAYSFDDLTKPMTRQQVQAAIYNALATVGVNTTTWKSGAVVRAFTVAVSATIAALTSFQARVANSGFLERSAGDWLTTVAKFVYFLDREEASYATSTVTLTNTAGGVYTVAVGDLLVANTVTGKQYYNTVSFTLGALQTDLPPVPISAKEPGSASAAAAGEITTLTTVLPGVECTNASAFTARDRESDPELIARCKESLGPLSPMGPWDAYSSAVKNVKRSDGSTLGITRTRITKDGYGNLTCYMATATSGVDPSDVALAQAASNRYAEPQCVTATMASATTKAVNIVQEVWAYNTSALTPAQIEAAIYSAQLAYMRTQPIGGNVIDSGPGKIYVDALRSVTGAAVPSIFIRSLITTPAADVDFAANEVPVLGTVLTTLHQVPTPEGYAP